MVIHLIFEISKFPSINTVVNFKSHEQAPLTLTMIILFFFLYIVFNCLDKYISARVFNKVSKERFKRGFEGASEGISEGVSKGVSDTVSGRLR